MKSYFSSFVCTLELMNFSLYVRGYSANPKKLSHYAVQFNAILENRLKYLKKNTDITDFLIPCNIMAIMIHFELIKPSNFLLILVMLLWVLCSGG